MSTTQGGPKKRRRIAPDEDEEEAEQELEEVSGTEAKTLAASIDEDDHMPIQGSVISISWADPHALALFLQHIKPITEQCVLQLISNKRPEFRSSQVSTMTVREDPRADEFNGISVEGLDSHMVAMIRARCSGIVDVSPQAILSDTCFAMNISNLLRVVRLIPSMESVTMYRLPGDPLVHLNIGNHGVQQTRRTAKFNTIDHDIVEVDFSNLDFALAAIMDKKELMQAANMVKDLGGTTIRIRVCEHKTRPERYLILHLITDNVYMEQCYQSEMSRSSGDNMMIFKNRLFEEEVLEDEDDEDTIGGVLAEQVADTEEDDEDPGPPTRKRLKKIAPPKTAPQKAQKAPKKKASRRREMTPIYRDEIKQVYCHDFSVEWLTKFIAAIDQPELQLRLDQKSPMTITSQIGGDERSQVTYVLSYSVDEQITGRSKDMLDSFPQRPERS